MRTRLPAQVLLSTTLEMVAEAGWFEAEIEAARDSSAVTGKGAVKDTHNLLGDDIRKLIRGLA